MTYKHSVLICGRIGSGKTSLINFLTNQFQIPYISFGSMVKKKASEKKINLDRKDLQDLGYEMFRTIGSKKLLEEAIKYANVDDSEGVIFDGVRHELVRSEISKISETLLLIYLNSDENTRYERYKNHSGLNDLSIQEFRDVDAHPIELGTEKLMTMADLVIDANKPFEIVCSLAAEKIQDFISN